MLDMLIDDHLVREELTLGRAEAFKFRTLVDQFDAYRQVRIADLRTTLPDLSTIRVAIVGVLHDGIQQALRLRALH